MNDETKQGTEIEAAQDVKVVAVLTASSGGSVIAIGADGTVRELQPGDPIFAGDTVEAVQGGQALVTLASGDIKELPRDASFLFTEDSVTQLASYSDGENGSQFEELLAALERGEDISEKLEETAAGGDNAGGGAGDEIGQGAVFGRSINEVQPQAGFDPNLDPRPIIDPTANTEIIADLGPPAPEDDFIEVIPDDGVIVESGSTFGGTVIDNDSFGPDGPGNPPVVAVNGDPNLVGQSVPGSLGGTLIIFADGTYEYMPPAQVDHSDAIPDSESFTYTVQDSTGDTGTATVTFNIVDTVPEIDILPAVPDATPTTDSINEGGTLNGTWTKAEGADVPTNVVVIFNAVEYALGVGIPAGDGTLTVNGDGTWTFVSGEVSATTDISFSLKITDSDGSVDTDSHSLQIIDVNKPPVAQGGSLTVSEEGLVGTGIPDTDPDAILDTTNSAMDDTTIPGSDPDGDTLSYTLSTAEAGLESGGVAITFSGTGTVADPLIGTIPDGEGTKTIISLTVDSTGKVAVVLSGPVDHANDTIEDNLSFNVTLTVSDGALSDDATVVVTIEDDSPTASIVATTGEGEAEVDNTVTVDESSGDQDDDTTGAGVIALFAGLTGTSTDLATAQYAQSSASLVDDSGSSFGADEEGGTKVLSLTIAGDGTDSGLETTDGTQIFLYKEGDLVVGRIGTEVGDGTDTADEAGEIAFAIAIGTDGLVSVAQYASITNPTGGASHDETASLSGKVSAQVLVTDGDLDTATASTDIGDQILFSDDGPSAAFTTKTVSVIHDETSGVDAGSNDVASIPAALATAIGLLTNGPAGAALGQATSASALVADSSASVFGADGAATSNSIVMTLTNSAGGAFTGQDSGLDVTGGFSIFLYTENGLIVGREGSDDSTADPAGAVAFIVSLGSDGKITVVEYEAIEHPTPGASHDEGASLTNLIYATVVATDGDGDTSKVTSDTALTITFEDDGPSAAFTTKTVSVIHDETSGVDAGSNDVASIPAALATAIGLLTNGPAGAALGQATSASALVADSSASVFGADGAATSNSIVMTLTNSAGGAFTGQDSGLDVTGGFSIFLYTENGLIVGREGSDDSTADPAGAVAFIVSLGSDGKITVVEYEAIEHPTPGASHDEGASLTNLIYATVVATDGDGDTSKVTSDTALTITFEDDGPSVIAPDDLVLENKGILGTGDQFISDLNFISGTDGLGSVKFNSADIDAAVGTTALVPGSGTSLVVATDANGNELKVGGETLYLYLSADGTTLTASVGTTAGGAVGYTVTLNGAGGTYIFNPEAVVSNGTEVTATNLTGVGAGNVGFKLLIDVGGTQQDVAMTTKAGDSVNSDSDDIGISGGQTFENDEVIRFDLVNGLTYIPKVNGQGGSPESFDYDGTHNEVVRWKQQIVITGNATQHADIKITAINAGADSTFYDPTFDGDEKLNLGLVNINIYNASNQLVDPLNPTNGITVTDMGDSIDITGLKAGWYYEVVTDDANKFDAIQVEALPTTDTFSLGFFTYGTDSAGAAIELNYNIIGTDGDGDTVDGTVDVTLYPDALSSTGDNLTGTSGADILLGTDGNDTLSGVAGADILAGNAGNDTLTGGQGSDMLSGGSGADTFKWLAGDATGSPADIVTDFNTGQGDVLDLQTLLVGETGAAANLDTFLDFTLDSGNTIITVDTNGVVAGGDAQTIVLQGVDLVTGAANDTAIIQTLLTGNNLVTDVV